MSNPFWQVWLGQSTNSNPAGSGADASINSNVLKQSYINKFLDVSGTLTVRYDASINGNLYLGAGTKFGLGVGAPTYTLDMSGTQRIQCPVAGVATTKPDANPGNNGLVLTSTKATGGTNFSMGLGIDYSTGNGYLNMGYNSGASSAQPFVLQATGGDVGIGSANPTAALYVVGNQNINGTVTGAGGSTYNAGAFYTGGNTVASFVNAVTINSGVTNAAVVEIGALNRDILSSAVANVTYKYALAYHTNTTGGDFEIKAIPSGATYSVDGTPVSRMYITASGNIGMGTVTPKYNLDVSGTGRFTSDVSINGNLVVGNLVVGGALTVQQLQNKSVVNTTTTNYQLIVSEDLSMNGRLFVSGDASLNGRAYVSNNLSIGMSAANASLTGSYPTYPSQLDIGGNILSNGIATTSPLCLSAHTALGGGSTFAQMTIRSNTSDYGNQTLMLSGGGAYPNGSGILQAKDLYRNSANKLLLNPDGGNVGVGTSSPGTALGINFGGTVSLDISGAARIIGNTNQLIIAPPNGTLNQGSTIRFGGTFYNTADTSTRNVAQINSGFSSRAIAWGGEYLSFNVGNNGNANDAALANCVERMRIDGSGNVGIGTTNPTSTLNLVNGTTTNTNPILGIQGYNVGASGTADAVRQPMIYMLRYGTGAVQNNVSAQINLGSHAAIINNYSTIDFKLGGTPLAGNNYGSIPDVNVMTLTGQGYVGIGTTNPSVLLDVSGEARFVSGASVITKGESRLILQDTTTATSGYARFLSTGGSTYIQSGQAATSGSAAPVYFTSMFGANTWMTLSATGNLGIGTGTPNTGTCLHLYATANPAASGTNWGIPAAGYTLFHQHATSYPRIGHQSGDAAVNCVHNFEPTKSVYWGEPSDTGTYFFRGKSFSKASGTFQITHPIDPSFDLVHSFVEGPRCDLIYRGTVGLNSGTAVVNIDSDCVASPECAMRQGTFEALCANPVYYLQNHTSFDRVRGTINGNLLTIVCENASSTDSIHWQVIAERKDTHIKKWNKTNIDGYLITEHPTEINAKI